MPNKLYIFLWLCLSLITLIGCSGRTATEPDQATVQTGTGNGGSERVFIIDKTGKKWDVTHAQNVYGFDPARFQFGSGPFAIPPILNPQFKVPGDPDYPSPSGRFLVIGYEKSGDARAYPLSVMSAFEVANDKFNNFPVAVGY